MPTRVTKPKTSVSVPTTGREERTTMLLRKAVEEFAEYLRSEMARTTAKAYATHARRFAKWIGPDAVVSDFTTVRTRTYMDEITEDLAAGSRCVYTLALRRFGDFLKAKRRLRGPNPARSLKLPKSKSRPRSKITDAEILAMWQATFRMRRLYRATLARAILAILTYTGLRCCELLALNAEHLRLSEGLLYVAKGKGAKEGYILLNDECQQALCAYEAMRSEMDTKDREKGGEGILHKGLLALTVNSRIGVHFLNSMLDELTALAQLKPARPFRPHAYRHALGSRLAARGVHINDIREMLRHEKIETTQRYIHSDDDQMQKVVAKASLNPIATTPTKKPSRADYIERQRNRIAAR